MSDAGLLTPDNIGPLVAVVTVGMCVGFMPHNFHPAKIIMGDSGALFLGTLMAATTLVVGGRTDDPFTGQTFFFYAPIFIPVFIMGVPLFDAVTITLRRAARGGGVAKADKGHLHHRLVALGHGQRRAVVILWAWTAILSGLVLYPAFSNRGNHLIPAGALILGVLLYTYFHPQIRSGEAELEAEEQEAKAAELVLLQQPPEEPSSGARNLDLRG
jgi:UDP-GlcNAc:undecaprenyl-phosphate GlcNAc-1-phosphate transferase